MIETKLHLGNKDGKWWVRNIFGSFYFGGSYESRKNLHYGILERRNDYYRSFPQKRFTIKLSTDNAEFQDMLDEINNTPYNSYE